MKNLWFLFLSIIFFQGCVNKHGISLHYYSDCKEYYDMQGFYHKECGEQDIITYEQIKKTRNYILKGNKNQQLSNVRTLTK